MEENASDTIRNQLFWNFGNLVRKLLFAILSVGPIPNHIAFILDGNRRFAKKWNLTDGAGHNAGFLAVLRILKYCYELGVKYVTIYAFSIDNFRRKPHQVQLLMNLLQTRIQELADVEGLVHQLGVRVYFTGNLDLLADPVKIAIEHVIAETKHNTKAVLVVCISYTSTDEITHSIQTCSDEFSDEFGVRDSSGTLRLEDIERNMYMAIAPDPDILVRTSGETRLSNFLLWQTASCLLYSPETLWPEIGIWDLVWAVMNFQRGYSYTEKKKKKAV